jgi:type IV secretory pathway VirB10-like protein
VHFLKSGTTHAVHFVKKKKKKKKNQSPTSIMGKAGKGKKKNSVAAPPPPPPRSECCDRLARALSASFGPHAAHRLAAEAVPVAASHRHAGAAVSRALMWTVPNFLTARECDRAVAAAREIGFDLAAHAATSEFAVRLNDRASVTSRAMAGGWHASREMRAGGWGRKKNVFILISITNTLHIAPPQPYRIARAPSRCAL